MTEKIEEVAVTHQEHRVLLGKLQALEREVAALNEQRKKKRSLWLSVKKSFRSFFSRDNLELFLSLTSLAISVCVAVYLVLQ